MEKVTRIRIAAEDDEHKRRVNEEQRRKMRQEKLDFEQESSARRTAAVAMKWAALAEKDVPQELLEDIQLQREACSRIIASKDNLLRDFTEEIRRKDEEYVAALKSQAESISSLIANMKEQTAKLVQIYIEELLAIEKAFVSERAELLDRNRTEVETAMEKRRGMEVAFLDAKQKRIIDEHKELDEMRLTAAEEYNILKIRMETEIQGMEQQLEEMRAMYQLNQEKLDYNWKVLNEREQENEQTIKLQRKKLHRLQDALSALIQKYQKTDKEFRQENITLTEEYRRITESFKDLQSKFRHFEISDGKRYREMWAMHEKEVTQLVQKVLQADKLITEQQLGFVWIPPSDDYFDSSAGSASNGNGNGNGNPEGEERRKRDEMFEAEQRARQDAQYPNDVINTVLQLISDEAGFLLEDRVRAILEPLPTEERSVVKVDAVLKVLGVSTAADVEKLVTYFLKDPEASGASPDTDAFELIPATAAVDALRAFIEDHQARLAEQSKIAKTNEQLSLEEEKKRADQEEQNFWRRMGGVISERHWRVWVNLEKHLMKYNKSLQERSDLITETDGLYRQNQELRNLLSQYLTASVNQDLIVPPMETMKLIQH